MDDRTHPSDGTQAFHCLATENRYFRFVGIIDTNLSLTYPFSGVSIVAYFYFTTNKANNDAILRLAWPVYH